MLSKWIYTIVVIMIFVTFIEMLMPSSSMKKYIKLILGLLVMTIILQPVFQILKGDFSLTAGSFKYQSRLDSLYIQRQADEYNDKQSVEVTKQYKKNLENQICGQVKKEIGDRNIEVAVDIVEDMESELYGSINSISISIGKEAKAVDKVERVVIGPNEKEEEKAVAIGYESLRNKISAAYDLNKDMVVIITKK